MNADPTDTRYPHLDLGDLIAGAAGQPIGDRARDHLTSCQHCQREADRWDLVADGIRGLAAAAPGTAQPARPRHTVWPVLAGTWRRALLVAGSAAAVLVLLVGVGEVAGVVHVHVGASGTGTVLTAVTGCSQLEQADGTLEQVNGSDLVIKTASGQPVTVTTTATTFVAMSGPLLGDVTDGASVVVRGPSSGPGVEAATVTVYPPSSGESTRPVNQPPGFVTVRGAVSDASTAGFTVVTSTGTRVPVTTSGDTLVTVLHASPGQLQAGATIFALGHAGSGGTLAARAVASVRQLPPVAGRTVKVNVKVKVRNCSPSSIDEAIGTIGAAPVSGG